MYDRSEEREKKTVRNDLLSVHFTIDNEETLNGKGNGKNRIEMFLVYKFIQWSLSQNRSIYMLAEARTAATRLSVQLLFVYARKK